MKKVEKIVLELRRELSDYSIYCRDLDSDDMIMVTPKHMNGKIMYFKIPWDMMDDIDEGYYLSLLHQLCSEIINSFSDI